MNAASAWPADLSRWPFGGGVLVDPRLLISVGIVLTAAGVTMLWASGARAGHRRTRSIGPLTGRSGALVGTVLTAVVITGAEWALVSPTGPAAVWLFAFGFPAFLAGATVWRLLALARTVHVRRRRARAAHPGRWNGR